MAFTAIIAHRIQRENPTASINTHTRSQSFDITGILEELCYELKTQFIRKGGKQYGKFSTETIDYPFSSWLTEFRQDRLSFESFTQKATQHFKNAIETNEVFIDAYLFFVMEKIEAGEFLYIYLVEHMSAVYLDSDLTLNNSQFLDTSGFTLAAKANLHDWDNGDSATYLTIMRARGDKEISEAFTQLVGFSDKHDIKTETVEFLQIVDHFSNTLDEPTAKATRTKVVDFCLEQHKTGKPIVIAELSQNLSQELKSYEPEKFSRFVEETQPTLKTEFIPDSSQLRNYIRISGRNDSLSMSFASDCLGKEIFYDEASDVLTIKNIPPALKAKLIKHLKGS